MAVAARESDALAGIAFNYRYVPAIQLAKQMLEEGKFGDIRRFRGQYLQDWQADPDDEWAWRNDAETAGTGALGDQGSHTLDLAQWLVGNIERVSGHLETFVTERPVRDGDAMRSVTNDDEYSALAAFENGAMGVIEGSRIATGHKGGNNVEVYGTDGDFDSRLNGSTNSKYVRQTVPDSSASSSLTRNTHTWTRSGPRHTSLVGNTPSPTRTTSSSRRPPRASPASQTSRLGWPYSDSSTLSNESRRRLVGHDLISARKSF